MCDSPLRSIDLEQKHVKIVSAWKLPGRPLEEGTRLGGNGLQGGEDDGNAELTARASFSDCLVLTAGKSIARGHNYRTSELHNRGRGLGTARTRKANPLQTVCVLWWKWDMTLFVGEAPFAMRTECLGSEPAS